jgi:hypothetical protein
MLKQTDVVHMTPGSKACLRWHAGGPVVYAARHRVLRVTRWSRLGIRMMGWPAQPGVVGMCLSDMMTSRYCGVIGIFFSI